MSANKRKGISRFNTWIIIEAAVLFGIATIASMFVTSPALVANTPVEPVKQAEQVAATPEPVQTQVQASAPVSVPSNEVVQPADHVNDQMILAALWMQRSAEYRALCYQAYNIALERLTWAMVEHEVRGTENNKPLALVLDCNDTVFTSIPSDTGLIGTSNVYTDELEAKWQNSGQVEALPGAAEFLNAVNNLGVEIFYVTNANKDEDGTLFKLMQSLGFPQVDPDHMLLPDESSNKEPRFARVAEKFNVVVYLGDNLNDMHLNSYKTDEATRNGITDENRKTFGVTRIMLPNPVYGDWERALADGYYSLPLAERDAVRRAALKIWRP